MWVLPLLYWVCKPPFNTCFRRASTTNQWMLKNICAIMIYTGRLHSLLNANPLCFSFCRSRDGMRVLCPESNWSYMKQEHGNTLTNPIPGILNTPQMFSDISWYICIVSVNSLLNHGFWGVFRLPFRGSDDSSSPGCCLHRQQCQTWNLSMKTWISKNWEARKIGPVWIWGVNGLCCVFIPFIVDYHGL